RSIRRRMRLFPSDPSFCFCYTIKVSPGAAGGKAHEKRNNNQARFRRMRIPAAWGWREKSAASLLLLGGCACLMPWVSPPLALLGGMALALALGNPWQDKAMKAAHRLLAVSVAGMGAGMNLAAVLRAGAAGLGYTFIGILLTLGA